MTNLYEIARRVKNEVPPLRWLYSGMRWLYANARKIVMQTYLGRVISEKQIFEDTEETNVLPEIFHYWSNTYLRPMYEQFGFSNPEQFFAKYLRESADACAEDAPVFISIGSGNCHTEIKVARLLKDAGLPRFVIECLDMNGHSLQWGQEMAARERVSEHIAPQIGDFNKWKANKRYAAIIANQSLHHVVNLEGLLDEVRSSLDPRGYFLTSDMIGRNGHQRWPEALSEVRRFWQELPSDYRYNWQRKVHQEQYEDWDCSQEGFEGIRAQDILPLLLERFDFHLFVGCCNVIDIFIDRSFGPNFKADRQWDREFIDRLHDFDEQALAAGTIKPTHMLAAMTPQACLEHLFARGLTAEKSVRRPY